MRSAFLACALLLGSSACAVSALAAYPDRPIRLIVGFPPGGPADGIARLLAQKLGEALGQQIIVDNRPGAGGTLGAEAASKAASDGYTLFLGTTGTLASAPSLYLRLGYDPLKSFSPISRVITAPFILVENPMVPARSLREVIDLARAKPGQLTYGSGGYGSPHHIAVKMLEAAARIELTHVPYKGTAAALVDLLPGRIDLFLDIPGTLLPHVQSGKLRALAVAGPKRLAQLPDVPTTAEAGLPGYEVSAWFGLVAPSGTPKEIVQRLNVEVRKVLTTADVRASLAAQAFEPAEDSPEEFSDLIRSDGEKWARAVKASGARLE